MKAVSTYRQSLELACTKLEKGKNQEGRLFTDPKVPIAQELAASIDPVAALPEAAPLSGQLERHVAFLRLSFYLSRITLTFSPLEPSFALMGRWDSCMTSLWKPVKPPGWGWGSSWGQRVCPQPLSAGGDILRKFCIPQI